MKGESSYDDKDLKQELDYVNQQSDDESDLANKFYPKNQKQEYKNVHISTILTNEEKDNIFLKDSN